MGESKVLLCPYRCLEYKMHLSTDTKGVLYAKCPHIIIIMKIYIAHYRIAPNALTVSVRGSE